MSRFFRHEAANVFYKHNVFEAEWCQVPQDDELFAWLHRLSGEHRKLLHLIVEDGMQRVLGDAETGERCMEEYLKVRLQDESFAPFDFQQLGPARYRLLFRERET